MADFVEPSPGAAGGHRLALVRYGARVILFEVDALSIEGATLGRSRGLHASLKGPNRANPGAALFEHLRHLLAQKINQLECFGRQLLGLGVQHAQVAQHLPAG